MDNGKKKSVVLGVLGVFALAAITLGSSYAFFSYSRIGSTSNTITSGDVNFSFSEGRDVVITDAFPVADAVGAIDTSNVYEFTVYANSSNLKLSHGYSVILVSNNNKIVKPTASAAELESGEYVKGYFTNDQIKVNLYKTSSRTTPSYSIGSEESGVKLSTFSGFNPSDINGSSTVINNNYIQNETLTFQLRMWISDDVDYSNTISGQDEQISNGKYNGYTYSLKVQVTATFQEAGDVAAPQE